MSTVSFESYEQTITFQYDDESAPVSVVPVDLLRETIAAVYGRPEESVFIVAPSAQRLEPLLFALWSQQWPRLRREFRFSSGSLEDRAEQGVRFDLQVIPPSAEGKIERQSPGNRMVRAFSARSIGSMEPWVEVALLDLTRPSKRSLRSFFQCFAADVQKPRCAFGPLAKIFVELSRTRQANADIGILIDELAQAYPEPQAGVSLKRGLLGPPSSRMPEWSNWQELDVLRALLRHPQAGSFDPDLLEVERRASDLHAVQPAEAVALLQRIALPPPSRLIEAFALGCLAVISANEVYWPKNRFGTEGLLWILERSPSWLFHIGPWESSPKLVQEMLDIVARNRDYFAEGGQLAVELLTQGWSFDVDRLLEILAPESIAGILKFVDQAGGATMPSHEWLRALERHQESILDWLAREEAGMNARWIAASVLRPELAAQTVGPSPWLGLVPSDRHPSSPDVLWRAIAFMYIVGLMSGERGGALVAAAFKPLHRTLASNRLPRDVWQRLESHLPKLADWRDWDHCGRLRQSLVDAFLEARIEFRHFLQALDTLELFNSVIRDLENSQQRKLFVEKFVDEASRSEREVSPAFWEGVERLQSRSITDWLWDWR